MDKRANTAVRHETRDKAADFETTKPFQRIVLFLIGIEPDF